MFKTRLWTTLDGYRTNGHSLLALDGDECLTRKILSELPWGQQPLLMEWGAERGRVMSWLARPCQR